MTCCGELGDIIFYVLYHLFMLFRDVSLCLFDRDADISRNEIRTMRVFLECADTAVTTSSACIGPHRYLNTWTTAHDYKLGGMDQATFHNSQYNPTPRLLWIDFKTSTPRSSRTNQNGFCLTNIDT